MKHRIKWICFVLPLLLSFSAVLYRNHLADTTFTSVATTYFETELSSDTLSLHYTLANPEKYGISTYIVSLPVYDPGAVSTRTDYLRSILDSLENVEVQQLSETNRYLHSLYQKRIACTLSLESFPYHYEPLSPASGSHSQLLILLAEYPFYDTDDVSDYLALLSQLPDYLDSLYVYEEEKAKVGLLMASSSLQKTVEGCNTIITAKELQQGTHFLQETFADRLDALALDGMLSTSQHAAFLAQNNALLMDCVAPAYRTLATNLSTLYEYCTPLVGLAHKQDGVAYYEALLRSETGSYRSIEDIEALLTKQLSIEQNNIRNLVNDTLLECWDEQSTYLNESFPLQEPEEILQHLKAAMSEDFPTLSEICSVDVKTVASSLEKYTAPAFYLTPPIDAYQDNVIYINMSQVNVGIDNYTTLAHESFPGHLYQNMYSSCHLADHDNAHLRSVLWYGGYLEGWAIYTEFLSYDYAAKLLADSGYSTAGDVCRILKHNRSLLLSLYALMDIKIHYEGALEPEIAALLSSIGISDGEAIHEIYSYIVEEPTNYMKYYLGYLEIMEIKKQAQSLWGENYSDYRFHKFLLEFGPADFDSLSYALHTLEEGA